MWLTTKVGNVVRGVMQRWAAPSAKRKLWNTEYLRGRWDFIDETPGSPVYKFVEKYCRNGAILDLGCGSGNTGNEIDSRSYGSYTGVDISDVATDKAAQRSAKNGRALKNKYLQSDVVNFVPTQLYDVILMRESVYYIPFRRVKPTIDRYLKYLLKEGVFIVNASKTSSKVAEEIVTLIESSYSVVEKCVFDDGLVILVFRSKPIV
jgi:SAM-dependent methyltransferase